MILYRIRPKTWLAPAGVRAATSENIKYSDGDLQSFGTRSSLAVRCETHLKRRFEILPAKLEDPCAYLFRSTLLSTSLLCKAVPKRLRPGQLLDTRPVHDVISIRGDERSHRHERNMIISNYNIKLDRGRRLCVAVPATAGRRSLPRGNERDPERPRSVLTKKKPEDAGEYDNAAA